MLASDLDRLDQWTVNTLALRVRKALSAKELPEEEEEGEGGKGEEKETSTEATATADELLAAVTAAGAVADPAEEEMGLVVQECLRDALQPLHGHVRPFVLCPLSSTYRRFLGPKSPCRRCYVSSFISSLDFFLFSPVFRPPFIPVSLPFAPGASGWAYPHAPAPVRPQVEQCWSKICDHVSTLCIAQLAAVRAITHTYRMTNKPAPSTHSAFVPKILQPLRDFHEAWGEKRLPPCLSVFPAVDAPPSLSVCVSDCRPPPPPSILYRITLSAVGRGLLTASWANGHTTYHTYHRLPRPECSSTDMEAACGDGSGRQV